MRGDEIFARAERRVKMQSLVIAKGSERAEGAKRNEVSPGVHGCDSRKTTLGRNGMLRYGWINANGYFGEGR